MQTLLGVLFRLLLQPQAPCPEPQPPPVKLYTVNDWQAELRAKELCQCLTIVVSPDGNVLGRSRACKCEE